ncbi:MAG: lamin tail domain-containing protein, partial [Fidelibacterota bacterium]
MHNIRERVISGWTIFFGIPLPVALLVLTIAAPLLHGQNDGPQETIHGGSRSNRTRYSDISHAGHSGTGALVITEIMQNPLTVADTDGEWVELHNAGTDTADLQGWTLKDDGTDSHIIIDVVIIAPGAYIVLGNNSDSLLNGGVDLEYQYSNIYLGNSEDELLLINPSGDTVDVVRWDNGLTFPDPDGASMALLDPALDNSIGTNWEPSTIIFGAGDYGTPGAPNFISIIDTDPSQVFFDTTAVGTSSVLPVTITNAGNIDLIVDNATTLTPYFEPLFTTLLTIPSGNSALLDISFTPDSYGDHFDTLLIHSNAFENELAAVPLSGFGYLPVAHITVSTTTLAFPETMVGMSSTMD